MARASKLSDDDIDTLLIVLDELIEALRQDGAAVLFTDRDGQGVMSVHLLGDPTTAACMLEAAPAVFNKVYGRPEGATTQ